MKHTSIIVVLLLTLLSACKKEKNLPESFDYGIIEDTIYKNNFFRFKMGFPQNWHTLTTQQINAITDNAIEGISVDDDQASFLDASLINVANLFSAYELELGETEDFNTNMTINCENISHYTIDVTLEDYIENAKKIMNETSMIIDFKNESYQTINGTEFLKLEMENNTYGYTIYQEFYSTIKKGFAFNIVMSYADHTKRDVLDASLKSVIFKDKK